MRVLCDSSVLIAALLPSEDHHAASAAALNGADTVVVHVHALNETFATLTGGSLGFLVDANLAARMIRDGEFYRDARLPVNASGGATCGTPISATGLIRVIEATLQLRGTAGERQIKRQPRRAAVSAIGGLFQLQEVGILEA